MVLRSVARYTGSDAERQARYQDAGPGSSRAGNEGLDPKRIVGYVDHRVRSDARTFPRIGPDEPE